MAYKLNLSNADRLYVQASYCIHAYLVLVEAYDIGGESCSHVTLSGSGIVEEPQLQWNEALVTKVYGLDHLQ